MHTFQTNTIAVLCMQAHAFSMMHALSRYSFKAGGTTQSAPAHPASCILCARMVAAAAQMIICLRRALAMITGIRAVTEPAIWSVIIKV